MTLSLQHSSTPWDRTLPRPPLLLPHDGADGSHRRSTSLLQHHIVRNQLLGKDSGHPDENGRRSTVACIPVIRLPENTVVHADGGGELPTTSPDLHGQLTRKRNSSVMSTDDRSRSSSSTSASPVESSGQFCLCQREPKIPRPRNAFILYRQHHHAAVVAQNPGLPNPDISKIIGEQWRQLPDKAKEEWKALAEDEKARHSQQYPDYRYRPKRTGRLSGQTTGTTGTQVANENPAHCHKCGGKFVHTPLTPFTPITPMMPVVSTIAQMGPRMSTVQPIISPPNSGRMRQYHDAYGRIIPQPNAPRFQYAPVPQRIGQTVEGPETKKRRFNGDTAYANARPPYPDQVYQQSPRERTTSDAIVTGQFHRPNMGPPARTGYPVQVQATRPSHTQHRRDHSLTLPPLKTPLSQQVPGSLTAVPHSQKSGVEAMIMSIPVLNKVKILSQIAPLLAAPGPASPRRETRGAIIAVEGMDPGSVCDMTNSLAEQLEREGKFAVRIFGGPDPYNILASSNRASTGSGEHLSVSGFLDLISQWHKVSKEMQDYITSKPKLGEESPDDVIMQDQIRSDRSDFPSNSITSPRPKTPVSAVSPKTITQTADLSLQSPPISKPQDTSKLDTSLPKSRIPASAIAQAEAEAEAESQRLSRSESTTPRPNNDRRPTTIHGSCGPLVPIAIVPHYQLTTVDASSIALPITDAYSPHSHWQWLATLWRGCIGPDATVIIQAGDAVEETELSATTNTRAPSIPRPPPQPQQDVEVRLQDCRAVVVRGIAAAMHVSSTASKSRTDSLESNEWWEKAKRRVGFEVEEFLRK